MSVRVKFIIANIIMFCVCITAVVGGMIKTTAEFMSNVAESAIGDHAFSEVITVIFEGMVDFEYMARHDRRLFSDKEHLAGIEKAFIEHDVYLYIEYEGRLTYRSRENDRIGLDRHLDKLTLITHDDSDKSDAHEMPFDGYQYEENGKKYFVMKRPIEDTGDNPGYIYIVTPFRDMSRVSSRIFHNFFKSLIILVFVAVLVMLYLVTILVIKPLKVLEAATEKIRKGELDFSIKTKRKDEFGQVINAFDTMRDELHKSIEQKLQYEENRKELIASISHDLKTPITSIKGYVEGIQDGVASDDEKRQRYLDVIYQKSVDMDQLIDDLFLFSKLDLNRVPFSFSRINGHRYFDDSYDELRIDLEKIGFELIYRNELKEETKIDIDPQQFKRVIHNIINNGVKYSEGINKIDFSVTEDDSMVYVEVKDYGKGIDDEDLKRIFDKFYRCDLSRNSDIKGSGLGLAIAKQIMDQHKGRIWAESVLGEGTTVHLTVFKAGGRERE